jgi:hypothetical protein
MPSSREAPPLCPNYRSGAKLLQIEAAIYRLMKRHGRDYWTDQVAKLVIHDKPPYPDGKYLIKGGGPSVWKRFNLRGLTYPRRVCGCAQGERILAERLRKPVASA